MNQQLDTLLSSVNRAVSRLRRDESGLTLIEVIVSSLMVVLIGGSFVALGAVQTTTGDQQRRSQAADLAQQDQERMRGMSADQLSNLSESRDVVADGITFEVTSTGKFINRSSGGDTCSAASSGAADYIRTTTSVTWDSNERSAVVVNGLATPPAGGSVVTRTIDQNGAAVAGSKILASGSSSATLGTRRSGTTDSTGCTIFPAMPVGDYDLSASLSGYVNPDGAASSTATVTATTTGTATKVFPIGRAGGVTATFSTVIGGATLTGQQAPSIGWSNSGMATPRYITPAALSSSISTGTSLYPFISGSSNVYTNNYGVWAGSCATAQPPSASRTLTTVAPGATATPRISMPGMDIEVRWRSSGTGSGTRVVPSAVKVTDSCNQTWSPALSSAGATATTGVLTYPGQPYGTYTVCASYVSGGVTYKKTLTGVANTSFAGTLTNVVIDGSGSGSVRGAC